MKYLVANWKSNKTIAEATAWLQQLANYDLPTGANLEIIVAAPFTALAAMKETGGFKLAAQDVSPFPSGAHTGEVSAAMLKDLVDYVIIGHSERREYFGESAEMVAQKTNQAVKVGLKPIICLDEPYLENQISKLLGPAGSLFFAYEPVAALKLDQPATPEHAVQVAEKIKRLVPGAMVLYGGDVDSENAADYKDLDGLLIGQASLKEDEFKKIIESISS